MQVKKQHITGHVANGTKLGMEYVYHHYSYLSCMHSTSCKILGCIKHQLESRFLGEILLASDRQVKPPLWQKVKRN